MEQKEHNRSLSWTEFIMDSSSSTLVFSRNVGLSGLSWKSFRLVGWQTFEFLNQRKSSCRSITFVTKSHFCSVCFIPEFWLFQRRIPIKKPNQTACWHIFLLPAQLAQADFLYVLLDCSTVITGQDLLHLSLQESLPGWSCLELSWSVTQMEGQRFL